MLPDYAQYAAVAAFIIGMMMLLVINIMTKNKVRLRTAVAATAEKAGPPAAEPIPAPEPMPVYPVYVDCSLSLPAYDAQRL
jgi:hypothetical protein